MTKSELVEQMAKDAGISKSAANAALNSFITGVTGALKKKDGKVTLVGFGTFSKVRRKARKGRNPQTGAPIKGSYGTLLTNVTNAMVSSSTCEAFSGAGCRSRTTNWVIDFGDGPMLSGVSPERSSSQARQVSPKSMQCPFEGVRT